MLQHLLPALIPSWRFFDRIGPAPHLEFQLTASPDRVSAEWGAVHPRRARVPAILMLARLFWNPYGNEALYLVSCAERLIDDPSDAGADDLWQRVADIVERDNAHASVGPFLRVRIVQVMREGDRIIHHVPWTSAARRWSRAARSTAH
jgi:hypothetical protein